MVKLYGPLVSLTLITSLALALPYPTGTNGPERSLLERNLDENFFGREYTLDEFVDLAIREPSFLRHFKKAFISIGRVAVKGLDFVKKVADNPLVQAAVSIIPGGGALVAAQKVVGTIGQVERFEKQARQGVHDLGGALRTVSKIDRAIKTAKVADRKVNGLFKHLPVPVPVKGALRHVKATAISRAKHVLGSARHHIAHRRHHRRDLEDDEELSRRDLDAEEIFDREYDDDFLVERDYFDDLD